MRLILVLILSLSHHLISQTVDSLYCINIKSNSSICYNNGQKIKFIDKYVEGAYKFDITDSCFKDINFKVYYDSFFVAKFIIKSYHEIENGNNIKIKFLEDEIGYYFDSLFSDLDRDFLIEYRCTFDSTSILNYTKNIIYFNRNLNTDLSKINDKYLLDEIFKSLNLYGLSKEHNNYIDVKIIINSNTEFYIVFENNIFENILNLERYLNSKDLKSD
jgi:hypothetical protein